MTSVFDRIAQLSTEERIRLERRLSERRSGGGGGVERRSDAAAPARLSFAQQGLWLTYQIDPRSWAYNIAASVRLAGRLDVGAFERAIGGIAARHEVLRARIQARGGDPRQVAAPAEPLAVPVLDLRDHSPHDRTAAVQRIAEEEAHRAFDHAEGPLIDVRLARLATDEHALFLSMDHIVADGWSIGIFLRELRALYASHLAKEPSPLAELPVQYFDFAEWQRSWPAATLDAHLSYWTRQLAGATGIVWSPDRPRSIEASLQGRRVSFEIAPALSGRLKRFSSEHGVSLFMTLLTAFKMLLAQYVGQEDVCVGTPIANRNREDIEQLIGFFVNMLVLRTDVSGNPTFLEALRRVRSVTLGAYAHQDLPFEKIVEELQPPRARGRIPLCQVAFALQNQPRTAMDLPGVAVHPLRVPHDVAKFDVSLAMEDTPRGLRGFLVYAADLFDAETMNRLLGDFERLLDRAVAEPGERLQALSGRAAVRLETGTANVTTAPAARQELVAPRTRLEADITSLWQSVLGIRSIGVSDNFFDLGGHSLLAVRLLARIEEQFRRPLAMSTFLDAPTIERLAAIIAAAEDPDAWAPLVVLQAEGSGPPLVCVHPASGSVSCFADLARALRPQRPTYGLRARHPADDPPPARSIEQTAGDYIRALQRVQSGGPYCLSGYSSGCTVAFEMAQQLRRRGERVALLALFDGLSPVIARQAGDRTDAINLAGIVRDLARVAGVDLSLPHDYLRTLDPEEGLRYVLERAKGARLFPSEYGLDWVRRLLSGLRARTEALRRYDPAVYDGRITLFRSSEAEPESARAWSELGVPVTSRTRGWENLSSQPLEVHVIPAYHATLLMQPAVGILAGSLSDCLDRATRDPRGNSPASCTTL